MTENQNNLIFSEKYKIRKIFYAGTILGIIILTAIQSFIFIRSNSIQHERNINQLSENIIENKKIYIKSTIEQLIYFIDTERTLFRENLVSGDERITPQEADSRFREYIKPVIRDLRLADNGYVWINKILDYRGGENFEVRLVHPNLPETEGVLLSTDFEDIMGNRPYEMELEGINSSGELFFDYYFKELDSSAVSHKLSYVKLYKPFDWAIGTGVYLNEVDLLINSETEKASSARRTQIIHTFLISGITILMVILILIFVERIINRLINTYEKKITLYTENLIAQKEKTETAIKEINNLQGLLPICSKCKKVRDDTGYWNQIEHYIECHSDALFSHSLCPECARELYGNTKWFKNKEEEPPPECK